MDKLVVSFFVLFIMAACTGKPSASIQGEWKLVSYGPPTSQIVAVSDVETSIDFDPEGRMSGNVGCNNFSGEYSMDGDMITFGPVMSTRMFCEAAAGQEAGVLVVLQESVSVVVNGSIATLTSADGKSSIVLERK
jgi:heat shock protein HslJ